MQTDNTEPNQGTPDSISKFIVRAVKAFVVGPDDKFFFLINGGVRIYPHG